MQLLKLKLLEETCLLLRWHLLILYNSSILHMCDGFSLQQINTISMPSFLCFNPACLQIKKKSTAICWCCYNYYNGHYYNDHCYLENFCSLQSYFEFLLLLRKSSKNKNYYLATTHCYKSFLLLFIE